MKLAIIEVRVLFHEEGPSVEACVPDKTNGMPAMVKDEEYVYMDTESFSLVIRVCVNVERKTWQAKVVGRVRHYLGWDKDQLYKKLETLDVRDSGRETA